MPDKSGTSTRDRKKKGGPNSKSSILYSQKHIRQFEKMLSQGSNVPVQGTNGHSKDGKGKNKKK